LVGGILAWIGFSLPSAVLLFAFATMAWVFEGAAARGLLHGLKLVAVAVVAHALLGMARSLAPDRARAGIVLAAMAAATLLPAALSQIVSIALGAAAGVLLCRIYVGPQSSSLAFQISKRAGAFALALFALLLVLPPIAAGSHPAVALLMLSTVPGRWSLVEGTSSCLCCKPKLSRLDGSHPKCS